MKLPAAAYSAEVATSATKAGSCGELHSLETRESCAGLWGGEYVLANFYSRRCDHVELGHYISCYWASRGGTGDLWSGGYGDLHRLWEVLSAECSRGSAESSGEVLSPECSVLRFRTQDFFGLSTHLALVLPWRAV